ncbi:Transmembrane protein [Hirschfeldia incana]|nr:Transmembrane protein [Hirschfeldia incana]
MAVAVNAGFISPLHNRSHPVVRFSTQVTTLKPSPLTFNTSPSPLLSIKRRLVSSCLKSNDDSTATTSVNDPPPPSSDSSSKPVESSNNNNGSAKRGPLTARERLRAARVLSRYTEATPKPSKPKMGSQILEVLKESDKKSNRKPGLPEAPTNMLDDSKRGMPKKGLTFDLPGSADILVIAFSFVFISTVMFATTYVVWKLGGIHFNEN